MTLSEISIKRPVFAWMLMAGLIIFGAISFSRMGISQMPDVDSPVVSINIDYEGAAPEVMETDVVDVLEDAIMAVQGIRSVSSYSRYGSARIGVEFELSRDIDAALQEIQSKVSQAQRKLPKDIDPPSITKTNPEDQPIMWVAVSATKQTTEELMRYVRDQLKDKFTTVDGVGEVILGGFSEPNLRVWVSNKKLNQLELSVGDVLETIQNEHSELPAGQIETERKEYDVRTMGEARTVEEFSHLIINERGGRPNYNRINLDKVAKVEKGLAEIRRTSRSNGVMAVGLGIKKQRGTNAVAVAEKVKERIQEIGNTLPDGMKIGINFDSTQFIKETVDELNFTLLLSAILTAVVCWMFLGSFSSTMNILLAIPTSIIGAFTILYFAGFTLNTFTLLGLSLAIGIVVDDAIMVLENIIRHREMGKSRVQAALDGSKEIVPAAIAASLAIIAIFLPVAFMRGVIGKYFLQFGITMTAAVALSLLEAVTLTPMRCAEFVDRSERLSGFGKKIDDAFKGLSRFYRKTLGGVLRHPLLTILGSLSFFALSMLSVSFLRKEFVPSQDQGSFMMKFQTPVDSSLSFTDKKSRIIEDFLKTRPEVERYFVSVGGFGGGDVNSGNIFVTLKEKGKRGVSQETGREMSQQDFMDFVRQKFKKEEDLKVFLQDLSMRGFSQSRGFPIEFSLRGPDWDKLGAFSGQIMDELEKTGVVIDLDTDYQLGKPEVRIYPDREKAAQYGVSVIAISQTIQALIGGVVAGKFSDGGHRYDVRVRLEPDERTQAEQVKSLFVRNNRGELVRLSDIVRIEEKKSLQQIGRFDRERSMNIFGNIKTGESQQAVLNRVAAVGKSILPDGYHIVMSGSAQTFQESFQDLFFALILGIVVAYMVLAAQFNSFVHPISVLTSLPFSLSGAFLALWVAGLSLNVYSFIGLILLMGIVKKNSILLVEFTNQVREKSPELPVQSALLEACPIRLRPILMTSFATIAGALPPALALGPGAETRVPMAVAVIGGVIFSTVLTLYVVPCVYKTLYRFERKPKESDVAV